AHRAGRDRGRAGRRRAALPDRGTGAAARDPSSPALRRRPEGPGDRGLAGGPRRPAAGPATGPAAPDRDRGGRPRPGGGAPARARGRAAAPPPPPRGGAFRLPAPPLQDLTVLANAVAFGPGGPGAAGAGDAEARIATAQATAYVAELRARRPWWHRLLWTLDP